jgi:predicted TIM-barrel fold metal-dependent hydrolase
MPLADAHIHLFADGFIGPSGGSPAGGDELAAYEALRDRHDIDVALVVGYEGEPRYAGNNRHVLALAAERDWIAPVAYLSLAGGAAPGPDTVGGLAADGAVGYSIYLPGRAEGEAFAALPAETLAELDGRRALLSLNATPEGLAAAAPALAPLESCRLLFSHLGLPGRFDAPPSLADVRERLRPLLELAGRPNVGVKLSGAYAVAPFPHEAARPFVDCLLEAFGPRRVLWGSDFAPALDYVSFEQAAGTHLLDGCAPEEIDAVMGANLRRLIERD